MSDTSNPRAELDALLADPCLTTVVGAEVDLQAIADQVHAEHFAHLPRVTCRWLDSAAKRTKHRLVFGIYRRSSPPVILIARCLRHPWVSVQALRFTIFHEYCHHAQNMDPARRSEPAHGKRFYEDEAKFPHRAAVQAWEAEHIVRLIDPVGTDRHLAIDISERLDKAPEVSPEWLAANKPPKKETDKRPPGRPPGSGDGGGGGSGDEGGSADGDNELRNELADADRFVNDIIGKAWYCPARAATRKGDLEAGWLVWDGKRLRPSEDGAILRLARSTALSLSAWYLSQALEAAKEVKDEENCEPVDKHALQAARRKHGRLIARADQVQTETRMHLMVSLARIDERLLIDHKELDADPDILNCQNGILHLPTGKLIDHHPRHRCTRIAAVPYDPNADRSALDVLLNRACMEQQPDGTWKTDVDRIRYLQDAIGSGLYGHQNLQRFYLCIGRGGDGKGTLFESLLDALGGGHDGYAMKADMQSFVRQKVSGHRIRDDLANMAGARLVLAAEINKGEALDAALVKTLSGEDTQRVRHLFGKEFEFRPICTLFMQANHEPYVDSQDDAIWRRLVKIPFGPVLRDEERDPAVRAALHDPKTGGAALLAWAAEGAKRTHRAKRLDPTPSVTAATRAYREEMNPLAGFLIDELRFASKANAERTYVEQRAIRPAFEAWQKEIGFDDQKGNRLSGKRIGQQLRECGAWSDVKFLAGKSRKVWFGVTLRHDSDLFSEHCHTTWSPTTEEHEDALLASGAIDLTSLPHRSTDPGAREINISRARAPDNFISPTRGTLSERGNEVRKGNKQTDPPDGQPIDLGKLP